MADGIIVRTKNVPEEIARHIEDKDLDVIDFSEIDLDENEDELKKRVIEAFEEKSPSE